MAATAGEDARGTQQGTDREGQRAAHYAGEGTDQQGKGEVNRIGKKSYHRVAKGTTDRRRKTEVKRTER